ncbi:hypothetical protein DFA_03702 [Cavenderia fasciculata]|uniref:Uncharacterized protein n=1 Tax=Cavenderia fasciculata TaxID=261658 RepID=F4Q1R5_CACFS|nr:uncharacterized protein DFA_03702 [Cavenderia fasciculata]EGG18215.1 hypothetical protein DFA_03702 [Cavenderia fasciculata]|eukprot:XP_004357038.1 hypothetical protein DFA_03702 [Cavenderia fasciculata]
MSFDEIIQAIDRLVVDLKEYKETDDIDKDKDKDIDNIPTINDNDINNNEIDDKKNDDMAMPDKCVSSETTTNDDIEPPSPSSHRPPPPTIQSSLETITLRNTQTVIEIKKVKKIKEYEWLGSLEKVVELVNYLSSPRLEFVWYRDAILCATDQAKLIEEMWKLTFLLEPYVSKSYLVFGGVHELVSKLLRLVNTFQEEKSMFINSMATHWKLLYRLGATVKRLNEVLLIELSTIALEGIEIANEHRTMGLNNVDELIRRVNSGEKYELLALEGLYAVISSYTDDTALIPNEKVVEVAKQLKRKHGEEMMWIIHNVFTTASPEQIDYCVSHGCLDVFVSISLLIMSDSKARHRWVGVLHLIMSTRQSKAHLIELGVMQVVYDLLKITGDSEEFDTLRTVEGDFLELLNI